MENIKQIKSLNSALTFMILSTLFFSILGQNAYANDVVAAGENFLDALFSAIYTFVTNFLSDVDVMAILNIILEALLNLVLMFVEALEDLEVFEMIKEFIISMFGMGTEIINDTVKSVEEINV